MNLQTLTEAFTELERRADTAFDVTDPLDVAEPTDALARPVRAASRRVRLVPASAAAVLVLGVVTGTALLARTGGSAPDGGPAHVGAASAPATSSSAAPVSRVPRTAEQLAQRLRTVLGDGATFTVTDTGTPVTLTAPPAPPAPSAAAAAASSAAASESAAASSAAAGASAVPPVQATTVAATPAAATPAGAAIVGTLTAAGRTGGFDLQIFQTAGGEKAAWCDGGTSPECTVRRLADGSWLAVGRHALGTGAVTYQVNLIRPDGVETLMHVSNERDPKGGSEVLATQPPLTTDQMISIVTAL